MKSPPEQWHDDIARDRLEEFIAGEAEPAVAEAVAEAGD